MHQEAVNNAWIEFRYRSRTAQRGIVAHCATLSATLNIRKRRRTPTGKARQNETAREAQNARVETGCWGAPDGREVNGRGRDRVQRSGAVPETAVSSYSPD